MYKNLKFSWAHIIALVALISIGVLIFLSDSPVSEQGDVNSTALWRALLWCLAVAVLFVGAQQLKGVDNSLSFRKCIWAERLLFFASPIALLLCMMPVNHTFNIIRHISDDAGKTTSMVVSTTDDMFSAYEGYVDNRVNAYKSRLEQSAFGAMKVDVEQQLLRLQLKNSEYETFKLQTISWLDDWKSNSGTDAMSGWNPFILTNIYKVKEAIQSWSETLSGLSSKKLKYESPDAYAFNGDSFVHQINQNLNNLVSVDKDSLSLSTVVYYIISLALLSLPYWVQERNGVSTYSLLGRRYIERADEDRLPDSDPEPASEPEELSDCEDSDFDDEEKAREERRRKRRAERGSL
ncbi:MAG: hypothetical protein ACI35Q_04325 [Marinilabiliaceae bacterium]